MTERIDRQPITMNTLYYGDNLKVLRQYIPTESIDLIYLDPRSIQAAIIMYPKLGSQRKSIKAYW